MAFFSSANGVSGLWKLRILLYQLVAIFYANARSGAFWAPDSVGATDFVGRIDSQSVGPVVLAGGVESNPDQSFIDETGEEKLRD